MTERQEQMIFDEGRRRGFEEGKEYILKTMIVIPNNVEPGSETFIGEDIVVCHHDDYMNMMLDAAQWNEYGEGKADRPKGEWLPFEYGDDTWHKCSVCGIADKYKGSMPRPNGEISEWEYVRNFCPNCGADMRGANNE